MIGDVKKGDARVRRALDQLGLRYEIDGDGDFKIIFDVDDGRTQLVFIDSNTETLGDVEIREIWSIGYRTEGEIDQKLANELLRENRKLKLGAWRASFSNGKSHVTFGVQVAAAMDGNDFLRSILSLVARKADQLEKTHGGGDEF